MFYDIYLPIKKNQGVKPTFKFGDFGYFSTNYVNMHAPSLTLECFHSSTMVFLKCSALRWPSGVGLSHEIGRSWVLFLTTATSHV